MKHLNEFKLNEMNDDKFYNVWKTLSAICNGKNSKGQSYLSDSWNESGEKDPELMKKLRNLKFYLNQLEDLG